MRRADPSGWSPAMRASVRCRSSRSGSAGKKCLAPSSSARRISAASWEGPQTSSGGRDSIAASTSSSASGSGPRSAKIRLGRRAATASARRSRRVTTIDTCAFELALSCLQIRAQKSSRSENTSKERRTTGFLPSPPSPASRPRTPAGSSKPRAACAGSGNARAAGARRSPWQRRSSARRARPRFAPGARPSRFRLGRKVPIQSDARPTPARTRLEWLRRRAERGGAGAPRLCRSRSAGTHPRWEGGSPGACRSRPCRGGDEERPRVAGPDGEGPGPAGRRRRAGGSARVATGLEPLPHPRGCGRARPRLQRGADAARAHRARQLGDGGRSAQRAGGNDLRRRRRGGGALRRPAAGRLQPRPPRRLRARLHAGGLRAGDGAAPQGARPAPAGAGTSSRTMSTSTRVLGDLGAAQPPAPHVGEIRARGPP